MTTPRTMALAASTAAIGLCAAASAQTTVVWDAASGFTPGEDVPTWDAFLGPFGSSTTCDLASATLGATSMLVDTAGCVSDVGLYRVGAIPGGTPTPPTHFIEGELRVRTSLGSSASDGPAAMTLLVPQNCAWSLHVDVGEILLQHDGQVVASTVTTTTAGPRRYRLEVDPPSRFARVYVDGLQRLSFAAGGLPSCGPVGIRWVQFGDLSFEEGGRVDWYSVSHDVSHGFAWHCEAQPNSVGSTPAMTYGGSRSVATNSMELRLWDAPPGSFGYFLCSRDHAAPFFAPLSQGTLCLGGAIGRFSRPGEVVQVPPSGGVVFPLDLTDLPQPTGAVAALPGDEWHFQFWYRDANPGPTSNLSRALQVYLE